MMNLLLPSHAQASGFSAGMVSAEEYWEMGAFQVHPSQRNAFQEEKRKLRMSNK